MVERAEGHYWVRFGRSPHWDVMLWRDGHFWGSAGDGYKPDQFEIGHQVFPPGVLFDADHPPQPADLAGCKIALEQAWASNRFREAQIRGTNSLLQQIAARAEIARPAHFHRTLEWIAQAARQYVGPVPVTAVAWTDQNGLDFLARGYGIDVSAQKGSMGRSIALYLHASAEGSVVPAKDVEAIRSRAADLLERMAETPPGQRKKRLSDQHVDAINEALRAEGFNAALRAIVTSLEVTDQMIERGLEQYSEGGCMGLDERERREVVTSILQAAIIPSPQPATHRHKKRGTEYVLIGIGKMQAEDWRELDWSAGSGEGEYVAVDMREVAIYRSATDPMEIWARPREEFEDGRFELVDPPNKRL